jgi:sensor domain CHASE-containing protein/signal transduction histidine kinase/HAMP domain-containing protein
MGLRTKTLLLTVIVVALALASMTIGARQLVLSNFDSIEKKEILDRVVRARNIVSTMVDEFQLRGLDWSDWDDMATYLADHNTTFEEANLTYDGLASCGWDHLVVLREDGSRVFSARRDREAEKLAPAASELDRLIDQGVLSSKDEAIIAGMAEIEGQYHLVASRPIKKTDHQPGTAVGRLVTSRLVDASWMERLRKFTFLDVTFVSATDATDAEGLEARRRLGFGSSAIDFERDGETHAAYTRYFGVEGQPLFDLRIVQARPMRGAATEVAATFADYGALGGLLLSLLAGLLMGRGVIRPLARVLSGVRQVEAGARAQVEVGSHDEIGQLAAAFNGMVKKIGEREDALHLVLDSTGEGLAIVDFGGRLEGQVSAPAIAWFGPTEGKLLWDWLPTDKGTKVTMALGLEQIAEGFLPFELAVAQLPIELRAGAITYRIEYKGIFAQGSLRRLLVVIRDATGEVAAERIEREASEIQAIARTALKDRNALSSFLDEGDLLATTLGESDDDVVGKRVLHTLKGNSAIFGLESVAKAAHRAEDRIHHGEDFRVARAEALEAWSAARQRILSVFGANEDARIELGEAEYLEFLEDLRSRRIDPSVVDTVRRWRFVPTKVVLERCARQAEGVARRMGKSVEVKIDDPGGRIPRSDLGPFFTSTVHLIRNAIDHGVETKLERLALGKPSTATIELSVSQTADALCFAVRDDGRGIDWDAIKRSAEARGLPASTRADLEAALFSDGLSTRAEVSELSGRGIGLGAVRQACIDAGGEVSVESEPGAGTVFRFRFTAVSRSKRTRDLTQAEILEAMRSNVAIAG